MQHDAAATIARSLIELKKHIEAVEARAMCSEMMIAALVQTHPNADAILQALERSPDQFLSVACDQSPTVRAAFDRLSRFAELYRRKEAVTEEVVSMPASRGPQGLPQRRSHRK